jgi:hypothetical protein
VGRCRRQCDPVGQAGRHALLRCPDRSHQPGDLFRSRAPGPDQGGHGSPTVATIAQMTSLDRVVHLYGMTETRTEPGLRVVAGGIPLLNGRRA